MSAAIGYASVGLMVAGAVVILIAMIGLLRFPDLFCRSHALGKGFTLGLTLLLLGFWMDPATQVSGLKIVAAILFQFVTLPVASHLLARLSYEKNLPRAGRTRTRQ